MKNHDCMHEGKIAVIGDKVEKIEETVDKIFKILNGNGKEGLVTNVALNKSSITRLWWFVGIISTGIFGVAFYFVQAGVN
ncbi:MAG: hypothetical protein KJ737_25945 [Proteobacteria bacterium]|nr:hypothetical protein [Pseudomonadota bacterium]